VKTVPPFLKWVGGLISAIIVALVVNFVVHAVGSGSPTPSPPRSAPVTSAGGRASQTPTASQPTAPYFHGSVVISGNGFNFDSKLPGSSPGSFFYNTFALETGGSNTAGFAVWTPGGDTPTAKECKALVTTQLINDLPNVGAGMKICFKTDQGHFGLLSVQPGTSENELNAIATVWGS
jgi:hypothetical protein